MIALLLVKLGVAHVLGDFVFQPDNWVKDRNEKHFASPYLYLHTFVHFNLALLALGTTHLAWAALLIALGHLIFDGIKAKLRKNNLTSFLIDQFIHLTLIMLLWVSIVHYPMVQKIQAIAALNAFWWVLLAYLTIIFICPKIIVLATQKWRTSIPLERELLYQAGRWIGILERILILTFILINQWVAIGYLLAAKSIFRFGDLKDGKDKGQTEYMLIGTLLSFSMTLIIGLWLQKIILHL